MRKSGRTILMLLTASGIILTGFVARRTLRLREQAVALGSGEGIYCWLSGHEALICRTDGQKPKSALFRRDMTTNAETRLTTLTRLFQADDGGTYPQISPDGKWALWTTGTPPHGIISLATLDGKRHFQCPKAKTEWNNPFNYWLADSRHWIELVAPHKLITHALIHDVEHPHSLQTVLVDANNPLNVNTAAFTAGNDIQSGGNHLALLPCGGTGSYCGVGDKLTVSALGIVPGSPPARTWVFDPPPGAEMHCGVALSPQGNRIAWFFAGNRSDTLPAFLHRLVPAIQVKSDYVTSLWVSHLDGSGMHPIGYQECVRPSNQMGDYMMTFAASAPGNLLWLPDGKHVSFTFQGTLYRVDAQ